MGFFSEIGLAVEEEKIKRAMPHIGAVESDSLHRCCDHCDFYVGVPMSGSKYYGACRHHQVKVFSNYICGNYS